MMLPPSLLAGDGLAARSGVRALQDSFVGTFYSTKLVIRCDGHRSLPLVCLTSALPSELHPRCEVLKTCKFKLRIAIHQGKILQLVSLLENRQSLTSWKFIVDVPCHGLVGTKFNHPPPSSCREGSKPSTGATCIQSKVWTATQKGTKTGVAHTRSRTGLHIYIHGRFTQSPAMAEGGIIIIFPSQHSKPLRHSVDGSCTEIFGLFQMNASQWCSCLPS